MAHTKKDLSSYITTVSKTKPSAEVKFKSIDEDGTVEETIASRTYVAEHADAEFAAASKIDGLTERLQRVAERNTEMQADLVDDVLDELDEEQLTESEVEFHSAVDTPEADSPLTYVPNAQHKDKTTAELSETAILIKLVSTLIDKVDQMQNFNPVIHVPAPVIHVTLPETKRTVTKAIERDENNWIKTVKEHIEEVSDGEPLIEVQQTPEPKKARKKVKKDNK